MQTINDMCNDKHLCTLHQRLQAAYIICWQKSQRGFSEREIVTFYVTLVMKMRGDIFFKREKHILGPFPSGRAGPAVKMH